MEPPTDLGADSIRDEKVKVVRSLRRFTAEEVATQLSAASTRQARSTGKPVAAYRAEKRRRSEIEDRNLRRLAPPDR